MDNIILTPDQSELIKNLTDFINDNRCYFGVYGPAGSGKSFTISYFINKHLLYDKVILSGTTNNACRVLEQSLDIYNNTTFKLFIEKINIFISDITVNIVLCDNDNYKINDKNLVLQYMNNIEYFALNIRKDVLEYMKNNKDVEYMTEEQIKKIKNDISDFIETNCNVTLLNKLYIKHINNELLNIFNKNKFIKTIHSLLKFIQCRDENHNIIFLPSKSNISEIKTKKGIKYKFTPKLTGKRKIKYDNMNDEDRSEFEKTYYEINFSKLMECELMIVDESSMMKDIEFQYVIYICKMLKIKVIFLGDKYQLPPVDDDKSNDKSNDNQKENDFIIDFSPAVKLKSSFTLSTIKRTSNPVLQDLYKTYRDLVERTSEGKVKIQNIQMIKNIQPTDKYLLKNQRDIKSVIEYVELYDHKLENTRILCFSNKEVNRMNMLMRSHLYGNINDKYVECEMLLVTNYMTLPRLNTKQLILLETCFENNDKLHFNYIFNKLIENNLSVDIKSTNKEFLEAITDTFKDVHNKDNQLCLYTSSCIKIIKIIDTSVYIKGKQIVVSIVFFVFEGTISLFFSFNDKYYEHIKNMLKIDKQLIKLNTDMYTLHKCTDNCDEKIKKHICHKCDISDTCMHHIDICNKDECTLVCNSCYECNTDCEMCIKQHKNHYSTSLWNKYIHKEYLLDPSINYSYATTVHKAQGQSIDNIIICEYNIANCILHNNNVPLYQKFLVYPTCMYTAITRSKNILVRLH
jgi:hypothetical protein